MTPSPREGLTMRRRDDNIGWDSGLAETLPRATAGLRGLEQADAWLPGSGPALACAGRCLKAGYLYLEVRCLGCNTHQTVALNIVRRPKATPVHELERYMRCHCAGSYPACSTVTTMIRAKLPKWWICVHETLGFNG
jgi:hypothetical protein